jgi:protein gp37
MNRQGKLVKTNGVVKVAGGIEWTKSVLPDGNERCGYSWNVVAGCHHGCQWQMPDGTVAGCYARGVAEGLASRAYPDGFDHHYWHPERLHEPLFVRTPSRVFLDSVSDLMGHWVEDSQIEMVLDIVRTASWHTFQLLTKNPARLLKFRDKFPPNLWVGASMPPDFMWGGRLPPAVQERMLCKALRVLSLIPGRTTFMSFEPLSWDVAGVVREYPGAINWAIVGAATNGAKAYQPERAHVERLLAVLDGWQVPVFFKGNLEWETWREEFPR